MKNNLLQIKLDDLRKLPAETEWVEFKHAKNSYDFNKLGKYFSALSNEANLKEQTAGWLVFGVENKKHDIVGTSYRVQRKDLDNLKKEIADQTNNGITFINIHEINMKNERVVLFEIPPASQGVPTSWKGHYYGRHNESLEALSLQELEQIRNQGSHKDWSANIIPTAKITDLSPEAILKAKKEFKIKHQNTVFFNEIDEWDNFTFLNKAGLFIDNKLTNTAIILLGKPESAHFIQPSVAKITWILKNQDELEQDYSHFAPPFILEVDNLIAKIRNLTLRIMPDGTLFPVEITQYDAWVMREALHNCIAHQDYQMCSRISVIENPDALLFVNSGQFIPGTVENAIKCDAPPRYYPNRFLVNAMVNLNMIDTIGSGIKRMFTIQKNRFMPLPEYNLSSPDEVKLKLDGKIIDLNYTKLLIKINNLSLDQVILLDKIQKNIKITKTAHQMLKKSDLVEGRYPNLHISAKIAEITNEKTDYIKHKAFDKQYYKDLILKYLEKFNEANRRDLFKLLVDKLPDGLTDKQKENKIRNLLYEMSVKDVLIIRKGASNKTVWILKTDK